MTTERKLIFGTFIALYFFIFATWAGWRSFHKFNNCQDQARIIEHLSDDQTDLVFSVWIFGDGMKANKKAAIKHYLGKSELRLQNAIEYYAEKCRLKAQKNRLRSMIQNYELYLITKQRIYEDTEIDGFSWIRKIQPIDPRLE